MVGMQILAVLLNKCLQNYDGEDDDIDDDDDDDDDDGDDDDDDNDDNDDNDDDNISPGKPQHCPSPASPTPPQLTANISNNIILMIITFVDLTDHDVDYQKRS